MTNKKTDTEEVWFVLAWKDEAGRPESMAGPKSALTDKEAELKKAKVEHTFEQIGVVTERSNTKVVAGKELEVREDKGTP